jgi:hypothetical protein
MGVSGKEFKAAPRKTFRPKRRLFLGGTGPAGFKGNAPPGFVVPPLLGRLGLVSPYLLEI